MQTARRDWIFDVVRHIQVLAGELPFCARPQGRQRMEDTFARLGQPQTPVERALLRGFQAQLTLHIGIRCQGRQPAKIDRFTPPPALEAVDKASLFIQRHVGDRLTAATVARHVGRPARWLDRQFRRRVGCSIHVHITRMREAELLRLLTQERGKNELLALDLGFKAKSSLYRFCHRVLGTTPARLRTQQDRPWA